MGSGFFQGSARPNGRVQTYDVQEPEVPFGSHRFRGGLREQLGNVLFTKDTGQARVIHDGVAFTLDGQLIFDDSAGPFHISMGGVAVNAQGGVAAQALDPQTFLSAIGLRDNGTVTAEPLPAGLFNEPLFQGIGYDFKDFRRGTEGLEFNDRWKVLPPNIPRFEEEMLLMEPVAVNKTSIHNYDPDEALSGITGDVTKRRIYDPDQIARAGLTNVCPSGYIIELENAPGPSRVVNFAGVTGNTNPHVASAFIRTFGVTTFLGIGGSGDAFESDVLARATYKDPSPAVDDTLILFMVGGSKVQILLTQLEEGTVVTSPIRTAGSATNRDADSCRWSQPGT